MALRLQYSRERLIQQLMAQGISNSSVLEAIRTVPRHLFIDEALETHAYANHPLPIGYGQTISQPYIVARMTEILLNGGNIDNVLEIGTGCGYQTAVLAQLVPHIYSIERIKNLLTKANNNLKNLGITNVQLKYGDGYLGWAENAPYQGMMVTAAPETIPPALLDQLAIGGCIVIPIGDRKDYQTLYKIVRTRARYEYHKFDDVNFVPMREGID